MTLDGDPTGLPCPHKRCSGKIVYNGNYFCNTGCWNAPDGWLESNPRAYYNLMTWRAEQRKVSVKSLINFNAELYAKGAP